MAQTNCELMGINFTEGISENTTNQEKATPRVSQKFLDSTWHADIIFVLNNLPAPPKYSKTKARFLKLKAAKFCIVN